MTLALDAESQRRFDAERARLFPPGRTEVGAHLTLFHAVPGEREDDVAADLAELAGAAFAMRVTQVMPLGRGAAYAIDSAELRQRHQVLQQRWREHLTAQDRQGLRAHITVQNKVSPDEARSTVAALQQGFEPFDVCATGFVLWRYEGGPWTELRRFPFPRDDD